ncbi:metallophosphoesterase [Candidatus Uhrbacteria bacterium]|nr:metallophosphoesterase [Candidatus Uhrbacteria bacterium]
MLIAHLSDLHLGKSDKHRDAAFALHRAILANKVDRTIVTGDITEHGLEEEFALFKKIFNDSLEPDRMTIVPGNHDRLNDEVAKNMMESKVLVTRLPGFMLIAIDSTGPHNRWRHAGHGKIDESIINKTLGFIDRVASSDFVIVALHHHLLPLPEDLWVEKISDWLRLPFAAELKLGKTLLDKLKGRCDLVLHGHRHAPMEKTAIEQYRSLGIYNAGSSTKLGRFRIFDIRDGRLIEPPKWVEAM